MISNENWELITKTLTKTREQNDRLEQATKGLMLSPESPLLESQAITECSLINVLAHIVGDAFDTLNWFVYECDYGRRALKAGRNDDMRLIDSYDQLRWLLELNT